MSMNSADNTGGTKGADGTDDTSGAGGTGGPNDTSGADTVLAAGCVLWRRAPYDNADLELCLVHRPKYDDWSHPKGKLHRGENALTGAVREVLEETGHHCVPGALLGTVRYPVQGRPKQVDYWAGEESGGTFRANNEVDRILWLSPAAARERLTQPRDRLLVDSLLHALRTA